MRNEFYFTIHLTENEHYIVAEMIQEFCDKNNIKVNYYRSFKNGHQPMLRECKITGNINKFKKFLADEMIEIGNENKKEIYKGRKLEKFVVDSVKKMEKYAI